MFSWYTVLVKPGQENKVVDILTKLVENRSLNEIEQLLVPIEKVVSYKTGAARTISKKIFPGYVFLRASLTDTVYDLVRSTTGVLGFICSGDRPISIPETEMQCIIENIKESSQPTLQIKNNSTVQIINGPFSGYKGKVLEINQDKVRISLDIFGRTTSIELNTSMVETVQN